MRYKQTKSEINVISEELDKLTIFDFKQIYSFKSMSVSEALPKMREFKDKHGITDMQATEAFGVAMKVFNY